MFNNRLHRLVSSLLIAAILLAGCTSPTPTPTPTAALPTATPLPSPTPTPSPVDPAAEGDALLLQSDFSGAQQAYERALAIDPEYGLAYTGLAEVYLAQGIQSSLALEQAQKGAELEPRSGRALAALALAQLARGAAQDAQETAELAVQVDPDSSLAQVALGRALLELRQYPEAYAALEAARLIDTESTEVLAALGDFYVQSAQYGRARLAYEKAAAAQPDFAPYQVSLGDLALVQGRMEAAQAAYDAALGAAPSFLPAELGLAVLDIRQKEYTAAGEALDSLAGLFPDEPSIVLAQAGLYSAQADFIPAIKFYDQALDLDAEYYPAKLGLANAYLGRGECDLAGKRYQELAVAYPYLPGPLVGRASVSMCDGDAGEAIGLLRKIDDLDPYTMEAHLVLAAAYAAQERWDDAWGAAGRALVLSPNAGRVHGLLGTLLDQTGSSTGAEDELNRALAADPYDSAAYSTLARLLLGFGRYDEALAAAQKAAELDSFLPAYRAVLGQVYAARGELEKAVETLETALDEDPENAWGRLSLGLVYRDLGRYVRARQELQTFSAMTKDTLDVDTRARLDLLLQLLENGYRMTDQRIVEILNFSFKQVLTPAPKIKIEELAGGRTLVIEPAPGSYDLEDALFVEKLAYFPVFASLFVQNADPVLDNGMLVRFKRSGQELFTVSASYDVLKRFADMTISTNALLEQLVVSQAEHPAQAVSLEKIQRQMAALRELELTVQTPGETMARADLAAMMDEEPDAESKAELEQETSLLTMLGLIPPGSDLNEMVNEVYSEQVAGFYDHEADRIFLIEQDELTAGDEFVLAHESTHALQDQHFDLDYINDPGLNDDELFAYKALVEGDATLAAIQYFQANTPLLDRMEAASQAAALESGSSDDAASYVQDTFNTPYEAGLAFVSALYDKDGWEKVNQAYVNLPCSSEQILHPERYLDGDQPVEVDLSSLKEKLGEGWQVIDEDVMGELTLGGVLAQQLGSTAAAPGVMGWGGDAYLLLQQGEDGPYALVMQSAWDKPADLDEFWSLFGAAMMQRSGFVEQSDQLWGELLARTWAGETDTVFAERSADRVTIVIAPTQEQIDQILGR